MSVKNVGRMRLKFLLYKNFIFMFDDIFYLFFL